MKSLKTVLNESILEAKRRSVKTFDEVQPGDIAIIQRMGGYGGEPGMGEDDLVSDENTGTVLAKGTYYELSKTKKYHHFIATVGSSNAKNYKYFVIVDIPHQGTFAYPYQLNKSYAAIVYK